MALLEIKNVNKSFGEKNVLNGVNMEVNQGEIVTIIGNSGNGKTTLLRCLNDLEKITSGEIILNGEKVNNKDTNNFGMIFQSFNLFPQYSALGNVTLALNNNIKKELKENKNLNKKELMERNKNIAKELLERMELSDKINYFTYQLSGGQCQRVAIARALALNPKILCFDEPTSALDPQLTNEIANLILDLKKAGNTIIVVTHDMSFAAKVSDKLYFMSKGKMIESGTVEEIFKSKTKEIQEFFGTQDEIFK